MPTTWYAASLFPDLPSQIACDSCGSLISVLGIGRDENKQDGVLYLIRCHTCGPRNVSGIASEVDLPPL